MKRKIFLVIFSLMVAVLFFESAYAAGLRDRLREILQKKQESSGGASKKEEAQDIEMTFAGELEWVHTDKNAFYDSSGRRIILRGFVTLTHHSGGQYQYTKKDYTRMKSWGANCQSIRFHAFLIGAWPGAKAFEEYLQKLDNMAALAKKAGIYTEFKLTMYGIRGFDWTNFWLNKNGEQEAVINGWKHLWKRYKEEPAVIGYDILNEPEKGKLNISDEEFIEKYLMSFYRKAIDEFQKIDTKHYIFFQPLVTFHPSYAVIACNTSIKRNKVVYAPHFYPNLKNYDTAKYSQMMDRFVNESKMHQAPLFIGEFGVYWNKEEDGNLSKEKTYQPTEKVTAGLFDEYLVGFSRPWFSDDRAQVKGKSQLNWALIKGTSGFGGSERKFIVDILARPYPQRTAGKLQSFEFDIDTKEFSITYQPILGTTEIFIPQSRHYKDSFTIVHSEGLTLKCDPTGVLEVVRDCEDNKAAAKISWDKEEGILKIDEWFTGKNVTIEIVP